MCSVFSVEEEQNTECLGCSTFTLRLKKIKAYFIFEGYIWTAQSCRNRLAKQRSGGHALKSTKFLSWKAEKKRDKFPMKRNSQPKGHIRCLLRGKKGKKPYLVHILVAFAFLGEPPNEPHSGPHQSQTDAPLASLRWATPEKYSANKMKKEPNSVFSVDVIRNHKKRSTTV